MTSKRPVLVESAPSEVRQDEPTFARAGGMIGWSAVLVGTVVAVANIYATQQRLIPEWLGWFALVLGLVGVFLHAAVETDRLLRQLIGAAGAIGVVAGLSLAAWKYKANWPIGLLPLVPGLVLLVLFARRETEPQLRRYTRLGLLALGAVAAVVGLGGMLASTAWLVGPGSTLAALGLVTLAVTLPLLDDDLADIGYWTAVGMSALGGIVIVWAILRSTVPTLLHEWRDPVPPYAMPLAVLGALILVLGLAARFALPGALQIKPDTDEAQSFLRTANIATLTGIILGVTGLLRLFATGVLRSAGWAVATPEPYLVPNGIIQTFAGMLFVVASVGTWSENRLVVLTRREFTAFFVSPIAYLVMIAFAVIGFLNYIIFLNSIMDSAEMGRPLEEPIIQGYILGIGAIFAVFAVMVAVPLLTMRLFAEEKRTGSLEVLLTAPITDWQVVLSKFFAGLMLFMLLWLPWALNLLALRLEAGKPFDFRPLLAFALALLASGASFIAMGLFFSSLTNNQIVAAALTFMGMMVMIAFYFFAGLNVSTLGIFGTDPKSFEGVKEAIRTMSFIDMWIDAIRGKILVKYLAFHLSAAVIWLLMTVKVLEARRWS
ncbi:MAG: ABC transporter permease [Gemmataceae bacterium]